VTTKFLLDTNIVSEPLRPKPAVSVLRRLNQHVGVLSIAALVWHELRYGCTRMKRSRRRAAVERYIDDVVFASLPILDYDYRAADWHAIERARLIGTGKTPPFVDGQIAAIARVNELTLVTANTTDFHRFKGLRIENWF
jgi:tRNA(fMet)-specific endonuclease VapC